MIIYALIDPRNDAIRYVGKSFRTAHRERPDPVKTIPCISLWQPWASLIGLGEKRIETRHWPTNVRGWIAIHAAKTTRGINELPGDCDGKHEDGWTYGYIGWPANGNMVEAWHYQHVYQASYKRDRAMLSGGSLLQEIDLPLGAIVTVARLVACEEMTAELINMVPYPESSFGNYQPGRFMWMLEDAMMLPEPIPMRGQQGFWSVEIPKGVHLG